MTLQPVTNSEVSDLRRCERMHHLGYVKRLTPKASPSPLKASEIGVGYHEDLEFGYNGVPWGDVLATRSQSEVDAADSGDEDAAKAHEKIRIMVEGYADWLEETGADQDVERPQPEFTARRELDGLIFQGKIDLLYWSRTWQRLEFIDHKSTGYQLSVKMRALKRSTQPLHYAWLLASTAPMVTHCTINLARQSLRGPTAVGPFYLRDQVEITPEMLEGYETNLRKDWIPKLLAAYEKTEVPAPSPDDDCSWRCPFFTICPSFDNGEDWRYALENEFTEHDPLARYREVDS